MHEVCVCVLTRIAHPRSLMRYQITIIETDRASFVSGKSYGIYLSFSRGKRWWYTILGINEYTYNCPLAFLSLSLKNFRVLFKLLYIFISSWKFILKVSSRFQRLINTRQISDSMFLSKFFARKYHSFCKEEK